MALQPQRLRLARDARGVVFEPLMASELAAQQNVHVVLTQPGEVRGNHWHRQGREIFAAMGPALVRIRDEEGLHDFEVPEGEVWRFEVPPGVAHAIRHGGVGFGLIVSFNARAHVPGDPDTEREILISPEANLPSEG